MVRYVPPTGNITSTVDMFTWVNGSVYNLFFPLIVFGIFVIMVVKLMLNSGEVGRSFAAASFICMIITILLRVANLINSGFMYIFIVLTAISVIWMHVENTRGVN